ncbi:MAG: helix-turn-helix domain-containing protein [Ardenticatenaceae bacterium]|nr:helix-turn-helix domain-containing protein [Ardenticatenaceae bacterium]
MIKNRRQLIQAKKRMSKLRGRLEKLKESNYEPDETKAFTAPLVFELEELEEQIEEYEGLVKESLAESIQGRLTKPVLLDEIGELLAKLRIASGLTQKDVADLLGWKQSNVSRFESENYQSQTISKVAEYADGLGVWLYVIPELEELNQDISYRKGNNRRLFRAKRVVSDKNELTTSESEIEEQVNKLPLFQGMHPQDISAGDISSSVVWSYSFSVASLYSFSSAKERDRSENPY